MNTRQGQPANGVRPWADAGGKSFTVLVIGGSDADLMALLGILGDTGWTVYWDTTRAGALETLRCQHPGVVLCDQNLPDGDWKDVLRAAESLASPPPVIVTARLASEALWEEVLGLNGYDILTKPFDARQVIRRVSLAGECRDAADTRHGGASAA
jgi:DNA-binding response OmpR family regulator